MSKNLSTSNDEIQYTEDELKNILLKDLEALWSKASRIFLGLDKPTKEQEATLKATRKVFEAQDTIGEVYSQTIGNLFVDLFDEAHEDLCTTMVEDVSGYKPPVVNKQIVDQREVTLKNYSEYIDRMMQH